MPDRGANGSARCPAAGETRATPCGSRARRSACSTRCSRRCPRRRSTRRSSTRARELHAFEAIQPADPPPSFHGELRAYQREGLGWLHFLRRFGFGGCLADDMGLGKTVQVLALLEARAAREERGPVAGRRAAVAGLQLDGRRRRGSRRELRVLDPRSAATARATSAPFARLRPRAHHLRHAAPRRRRCCAEIEFDYVILDEAQAIKNADSRVGQGRAAAARPSTGWR